MIGCTDAGPPRRRLSARAAAVGKSPCPSSGNASGASSAVVAPQISVNGPAEFTDASRGKGAFKTVMRAMDNLREAGCVFAELAI